MTQSALYSVREIHASQFAKHGWGIALHSSYIQQKHKPHFLDVILISFLLRGEAEHIIGEDVFIQKEGSIAIIYYGQTHSIKTDAVGVENINVFLDPERIPLPRFEAKLSKTMHQLFPAHSNLLHARNRSIYCDLINPELTSSFLINAEKEMKSPRVGSSYVLSQYKELFIVECCRSALEEGVSTIFKNGDASFKWLSKVLEYIDSNYHRPITLQELSSIADLSKGHLCRVFKREMGRSAFDHIINRRLQHALYQLKSGDSKVLSIALESGFSDLTYFNRIFKKKIGCSPRQYRQQSNIS